MEGNRLQGVHVQAGHLHQFGTATAKKTILSDNTEQIVRQRKVADLIPFNPAQVGFQVVGDRFGDFPSVARTRRRSECEASPRQIDQRLFSAASMNTFMGLIQLSTTSLLDDGLLVVSQVGWMPREDFTQDTP